MPADKVIKLFDKDIKKTKNINRLKGHKINCNGKIQKDFSDCWRY
jgi:hypothetical protein